MLNSQIVIKMASNEQKKTTAFLDTKVYKPILRYKAIRKGYIKHIPKSLYIKAGYLLSLISDYLADSFIYPYRLLTLHRGLENFS